jgi:hypothetical protein
VAVTSNGPSKAVNLPPNLRRQPPGDQGVDHNTEKEEDDD